VLDGESLVEMVLPEGAILRPTAAPMPRTSGSLLGTTPIVAARLEPGSYVALVTLAGYESRRIVFSLGPAAPSAADDVRVRLDAQGTSPRGFVLVQGRGSSAMDTAAPTTDRTIGQHSFWIMDREVTVAEYLIFLNDPSTRAEIDGADAPRIFPRDRGNAAAGGYWTRDADGRYEIDPEWDPDWPIIGVSFHDAEAYARWYAERLGRNDLVIALPTFREWVIAGEGNADRDFVFGDVFWPRWISSCYSQPRPEVERVLSYPIDESPAGVFDLSGGATEWLDDAWGSGEPMKRLGGGSWAQARSDLFKVSGGSGAKPGDAGDESGFRLVARRRGGER
jgi:formylglycine-generating enzyme required for sulfatase activity